jgi:plasmid stabilization system protein ParE
MNQDKDPSMIWAIRFTSRADADVTAAADYFADKSGIEIARTWVHGLNAEVAKLAQYPTLWPVAEEDQLFRENIRRMLYRRTRRGPAYRVLFVMRQNPDDAPTVAIIHVRHATQAPMTPEEAWEIEASE